MTSVRSVLLFATLLLMLLSQAPRGIKFIGEIYGGIWKEMIELYGSKPIYLFTIGTMASLGLPFWFLVLSFMSLDLWGKPKFLLAYKVQPDKNVPVSWKTYKKCLRVINVNQLVATVMILAFYPLTQWRGMPYRKEDLPSFPVFMLQLFYFVIAQEIAFYYFHRLMHHPIFYKRIHKTHHEWTAPISLAVVYVHPFEHFLVNMVPILLSPILIGAHLSSAWIWYIIATVVSTIHHSGYHFPLFPSPEFHDFHHLKFNQCFGTIGLLDWIHKTDDLYRKTDNFKHDSVLLSFQPISRSKSKTSIK